MLTSQSQKSEMLRLGKQYRVVREASPCDFALWLKLALLLFGLANPGLFRSRRDRLRKAFTDARIRQGEALRRGSRVCLRGDRWNDGTLIGINHHRFGSFPFGVDQDPGKLGPEPMLSFAGGRGIRASAANSSVSNAPPTQRKYRLSGISESDPSQRSQRPDGTSFATLTSPEC